MTSKKHKIKQKAKALEPHIRIGKQGTTKEVIEEITKQLNGKEIVKIKFLKSSVKDRKHRKALAVELAGKTKSMLIDRIGSVIVLHKPKKEKKK